LIRRRWLAVMGSVALIAAPALAQQQINLRDADIRAFIQDAARATGRTFVIDSRVQGKVSVVTDRPLSRSEYFEVFLSTLRANGLVAIPTGTGAFRIQPAETAAAQPGRIGLKGAARNAFVTEVFRLKSVDATTAVETLRPLVSKEGSVTANRSGNSLVVADYADNVRRIRALIARIDGESATTTIVALRNAGAKEVAASLQQLLTGGQTAGQNGRTAVALSAVESSNAIALRGDRQAVARFAELARDLDRRAASGSEVKVYWLKNADAEKLVPVLQTLSGQSVAAAATTATGAAPTLAAAPDPSGNPRNRIVITRYDGANAVIIAAPSEVQRSLSDVIRQLDTRRPNRCWSKRSSSRFRTMQRRRSWACSSCSAARPAATSPLPPPITRTCRAQSPDRWRARYGATRTGHHHNHGQWRPMGPSNHHRHCKVAAIWPARSSNRRSAPA
jgi:general secretion pathway protein D